MNRELFSDAMNEIDSKYVEEALTYKPAKRFVFPVWAQRCVAACLICVLGLGVVLAASPEARAEIQRWIETWRGSQVSYTYFGDPLEKPIPHYQITALPEGFAEELDQRFDETDCVQHSYRRGDERIILGYIYMQDDNFSFYDMGEDTEISELEVNGNPGKFYLSDDPALWSVIEWIDTEHSIHFSINACGTQKELLALAESVKPAEDDICTAGENTEPPVELGEGEIWREEPWTDKLAVAGIIEGTFSEEGLAAMSDVKDLTSQMAKELAAGIRDNVEDIAAAFKKMAVINPNRKTAEQSAVKETSLPAPNFMPAETDSSTRSVQSAVNWERYEGLLARTQEEKKKRKSKMAEMDENQLSIFDFAA